MEGKGVAQKETGKKTNGKKEMHCAEQPAGRNVFLGEPFM